MFEFLRFDAAVSGRGSAADDFLAGLAARKEAGAPREVTNRLYHLWWAGRSVTEVTDLARTWWRDRLEDPAVYNDDVLARWSWHGERGHRRVLISGSFGQLLAPLAAHLEADRVIATELRTRRGRFTGDVEVPMIGRAKRAALLADAAEEGLTLTRSFGYGDHPSDLEFLSVLGQPTLVSAPVVLPESRTGFVPRPALLRLPGGSSAPQA